MIDRNKYYANECMMCICYVLYESKYIKKKNDHNKAYYTHRSKMYCMRQVNGIDIEWLYKW